MFEIGNVSIIASMFVLWLTAVGLIILDVVITSIPLPIIQV